MDFGDGFLIHAEIAGMACRRHCHCGQGAGEPTVLYQAGWNGAANRMTEVDLNHLAGQNERILAELAGVRDEIRVMRAQLDGLPLVSRSLTIVDQNVRMLRSLNPTSGEIQALHDAVNAVQAEITELAAKIATLERLVAELQSKAGSS